MDAHKDGFSLLEKHLEPDWKIYIDTCSLYRTVEQGVDFWPKFERLLNQRAATFTITEAAFNEFKRHKHSDDHVMKRRAEKLDKVLARYGKAGQDLMKVARSADGDFHDNVIVSLVKQRCRKYAQVYITNDLASAWDVFNVVMNSTSTSYGVKPLVILRVSNGSLRPFEQLQRLSELSPKEVAKYFEHYGEKNYKQAEDYLSEMADKKLRRNTKSSSMWRSDHNASGHAPSKPTSDAGIDSSVPKNGPKPQASFAVHIPGHYKAYGAGAKLRAHNGYDVFDVELGARIGRGGEGLVFEARVNDGSQSPYLAKLYKKAVVEDQALVKQTFEKDSYIVSEGFANKSMGAQKKLGRAVKFPLMLLSDEESNFVGYLMKQGRGLQLSELISDGAVQSEFLRKYPNLKKVDVIDICLNLLEIISALHRRRIIVGDLNVRNILVDVDTKFVTLLDADSYQYGNRFPCNVGVKEYTSPEFFKDHSAGYRNVENELFVVARILFETLMLVDNPYNSRCSVGDPVADMLEGTFRYTFTFLKGSRSEGRVNNSEAPGGDLTIRWGHLTKDLKDALGNTFHCDGAYWAPNRRLGIEQWIGMLKHYRGCIERSVQAGDGWESNDVFPTTPRAWVVSFACKCGSHGKQDANEFKKASTDCGLHLGSDDIRNYASHQCFACFCRERQIYQTECSECKKPMYALWNSPYATPLCPSCRRKRAQRRRSARAGRMVAHPSVDQRSDDAKDAWSSSRPSAGMEYVSMSQARKTARRSVTASKKAGGRAVHSSASPQGRGIPMNASPSKSVMRPEIKPHESKSKEGSAFKRGNEPPAQKKMSARSRILRILEWWGFK